MACLLHRSRHFVVLGLERGDKNSRASARRALSAFSSLSRQPLQRKSPDPSLERAVQGLPQKGARALEGLLSRLQRTCQARPQRIDLLGEGGGQVVPLLALLEPAVPGLPQRGVCIGSAGDNVVCSAPARRARSASTSLARAAAASCCSWPSSNAAVRSSCSSAIQARCASAASHMLCSSRSSPSALRRAARAHGEAIRQGLRDPFLRLRLSGSASLHQPATHSCQALRSPCSRPLSCLCAARGRQWASRGTRFAG